VIVIDTSALIAIAQNEVAASDCRAAMLREPRILISAGTMAEALVVASGRGLTKGMSELLAEAISEVIPLTADRARSAGTVYSNWGKASTRPA
jgi:ribonuclease VapC